MKTNITVMFLVHNPTQLKSFSIENTDHNMCMLKLLGLQYRGYSDDCDYYTANSEFQFNAMYELMIEESQHS